MSDSREPEVSADAGIIDEVLQHLPEMTCHATVPGPVPRPPDLKAIAKNLGFEIKRGVPGPHFTGIAIPDFYSEREARLAIARHVARIAIHRVGRRCTVVGDKHTCPEPQICEFVESAKSDDKLVDKIAAAVLMPTNDFVKWANLFGGDEEPLSDSYAVPRELARIRLRTIEPVEASVQR